MFQNDQQLDCALDLMRRLPPQQIEKNLSDLIDLVSFFLYKLLWPLVALKNLQSLPFAFNQMYFIYIMQERQFLLTNMIYFLTINNCIS